MTSTQLEKISAQCGSPFKKYERPRHQEISEVTAFHHDIPLGDFMMQDELVCGTDEDHFLLKPDIVDLGQKPSETFAVGAVCKV